MPLVKLTIKHEPVHVEQDELDSLRGQGLLEKVLDEEEGAGGVPPVRPGDPRPAVPPVKPAADPVKPADPLSGETKEQ